MKPKNNTLQHLGFIALALAGLSTHSAQAAVKTWTGTTSADWGTGTNWGGAIPVTGDSLVFTSATGAGGVTLSDNLMTPGTYNVAAITFNSGSGAYVINPATAGTNGFTLTGNVTNSSTSLQTINDNITTTAVRTVTLTAGGGNLTLGGDISGTGGNFTIAGVTAATTTVGTLTLSGNNSFTGGVNTGTAGIIRLTSDTAAGTGIITVGVGGGFNEAGRLELIGGITVTNALSLFGRSNATVGIQSISGNNALTDAITIGAGGNANYIFQSDADTLSLGTSGVTWNGGAAPPRTFTFTGAGNISALGNIVGSTNIVTKTGAGTLTLSGTNTYGGATTVNGGTLIVGANAPSASAGALGTATSAVLVGDTTGAVNASLLTGGAFTVGRALTLRSGNTGVITLGGNTAAASIFSGAILTGSASAAAKNVTLAALSSGSVDFQGVINENTSPTGVSSVTIGDATHTGSVKLSQVANLYAGTTTISNGATLEVTKLANGGTGSSIGNSGSAAGAGSVATDLVFTGGSTLKYTGTGDSTNRLFTFDAGGATIDASASSNGALNFTGTGALVASGTGNRTLTLAGASTGANTMTSVIADPSSGATALTKSGAGTWVLSGTNTYTGVTSVTGGKLLVNGSNSGGGVYNVGASGTLGGPGSVGPSTINVSGVLSPGASVETFSSGTVNFATGSTFAHELNSAVAAATGADLQVVSGDLSLTGLVNLTLADLAASPAAVTPGTIFSLINYSGSWNGGTFTFGGNALADDTTFIAGLNTWQIDYNAATGGLNFAGEYLGGTDSFVNLTAVPEPASMLLGGLGLLALLRRHRK